MFAVNHLVGFGASSGSAPPAIGFYTGNGFSTADASSYSIPSIAFGSEADDRFLVACIAMSAGAARTFSGATTIGGVTATSLVEQASANARIGMFIAPVPTGTSGTVAFGANAVCNRVSVTVSQLTKLTTGMTAVASSAASPPSTSIDALAGGVIIGGAAGYSTATQSWTWSGITEEFDSGFNESSNWQVYSAAAGLFSAAGTIAITASKSGTNTNDAMVLAAFR